eukprot:gnl/TRDRNA2_/TRDRNA2_136985_c0_seq1.p1 gnl/TRDRNA2_/TRDRNA2_136985_c0~~gnl/TRDRNA2_/TRDRNA2_136985_c0_seq1.p1  ORF type:complete len:257 (+),score=77.15 gnl/TRDRNA2_/TRDRNA2_136985_c0_seq1:40-810(+)
MQSGSHFHFVPAPTMPNCAMSGATKVVLASVLLSSTYAAKITKEDWVEKTLGKMVMVNFHGKKGSWSEPPWKFIEKEVAAASAYVLIADADCSADGKSLCTEMGIDAQNTIKYGDPLGELQDFKGKASVEDFRELVKTLKPSCSPTNVDLCDDKKKKMIKDFTALSASDRESKIKEKEEAAAKLTEKFKAVAKKLKENFKEEKGKKGDQEELKTLRSDFNEKYTEASAKRAQGITESGLYLLKAVHHFEAKKKKEL